jgi:hypothetical protein
VGAVRGPHAAQEGLSCQGEGPGGLARACGHARTRACARACARARARAWAGAAVTDAVRCSERSRSSEASTGVS